MISQYSLLKDRRFLPLFVTQFLGAYNDNLMKAFFVVLVAYGDWDLHGFEPDVMVSLAAAVFIFPFVVFCPFAGALTDKYDKSKILRITKLAEIGIVFLAVAAIFMQSVLLCFTVLVALGTQSAFFSPGKFSLLPQHLSEKELIAGNGLISTGTYLAILSGTMTGTFFALYSFGPYLISAILLLFAVLGYWASRSIPLSPPQNAQKVLDYNLLRFFYQLFHYIYTRPGGVFVSMLGVSWFYFVAATVHAQFPNFAKQALSVDTNVLTICLTVFSLGIAAGGLLNNRILKSTISAKMVPFSAIMIAIFSADLYFVSASFVSMSGELLGVSEFVLQFKAWRLIADLFLLSFFGGLYIVPLRAIVQYKTPAHHTARVVSMNALTDSLGMLMSALLAALLLSLGWKVEQLFLLLSGLTFLVAMFFWRYKNILW